MKKIIILAMSCNLPLYKQQEKIVKDTYAKSIIEGEYPNIEFWIYAGSTDGKYHIQKKQHTILVPADDSIYGTFDKTRKVLNLLHNQNVEYDYIFRTNCSTVVNIRLLNEYVQRIEDDKIHAGYIYAPNDGIAPNRYDFFGIGNSILIPHSWCDVIRTHTPLQYKMYDNVHNGDENASIYNVDDNAIGFIVNCVEMLKGNDSHKIWKNFNIMRRTTLDGKDLVDCHKYIAIPLKVYGVSDNIDYLMKKVNDEICAHQYTSEELDELLNEITSEVRLVNWKENKCVDIPLDEFDEIIHKLNDHKGTFVQFLMENCRKFLNKC